MTMSGKELVKRLKKIGWMLIRIEGSHYVMQKDNMIEVIPVHGNKDLPESLYNSIAKRVGLK